MILLGNQSLVRVSTFKNKLKNTFSHNLLFSLYPPSFFFSVPLSLVFFFLLIFSLEPYRCMYIVPFYVCILSTFCYSFVSIQLFICAI